jgi:hypothetical protein
MKNKLNVILAIIVLAIGGFVVAVHGCVTTQTIWWAAFLDSCNSYICENEQQEYVEDTCCIPAGTGVTGKLYCDDNHYLVYPYYPVWMKQAVCLSSTCQGIESCAYPTWIIGPSLDPTYQFNDKTVGAECEG